MYSTQNQLLLDKLMDYYNTNNRLDKILPIINGNSLLSIRIIDWFVTNYAKKNYTVYFIDDNKQTRRFKVYTDYKLKLKAYSKKRFDPFCRWERIHIPYEKDHMIQTTIGQLNFFKWALENKIIEYIHQHLKEIEEDMNTRNSSSRKNKKIKEIIQNKDIDNINIQTLETNKSASDTESNFSETTENSDMLSMSISDIEQTSISIQNNTINSDSELISNSTNKNFSKRLASKTRKKREELSTSAVRSIKKEDIKVTVSFT